MSNENSSEGIGHRHGVFNTSFWAFVQIMVLNVGAFATTMYLTRMLSTGEYGYIPLVNAFVLFCVAIVGLGVPNALARFIAAQDSRAAQKKILVRVVLTLVPWALISTIALLILFPMIARLLDKPALVDLRWVFICVLLLELFRVFVEKVCHGTATMKISANYSLWTTILVFSATIPVVLVYPTALAALWAKVVALTLPTIRLLLTLKKLFTATAFAPDKELPSGLDMIKYGIPLAAISLSVFGYIQADILMLGYFGDTSMVGMYAVSAFLFSRLTVLARSIGYGVGPLFSKDSVDKDLRVRFVSYGLKYAMIVAIPVAVYAMVNGEELIVFLFGDGYVGLGNTVALLSVYYIMASALSVINPTLDFVGKAKIRAVGTLVGALVNVVMNILLIPELGIVGAAIGTILGFSVYSVIIFGTIGGLLVSALKETYSLGRLLFLVGPIFLLVLMAVRTMNEGASALVNALLICILYPVALLMFGVISRDEVIALKRIILKG